MTKLLLMFFISFVAWSQEGIQIQIHGKVYADSASVEGINVLNLVTEKSTITDKNGAFSILAKADDLLILTAVHLEIRRKLIEEEDLKQEVIKILMIPKTVQLKEVKVNENAQINAVSLGIVPKGIKRYTPAERKLFTANSGPVDALLNLISGRTAMLKKELEVEKKEQLLAKIDVIFEKEYYIESLKIPANNIKGFQYFCIEDKEFATVLKSKNKTRIMFYIRILAEKYNQIISNGK